MVAYVVENNVVTLCTMGEIFLGVINDVIRADGADHVHIPGTAYSGDFGTEGLGDLHGKRADASGGTVDQDRSRGLSLRVFRQAVFSKVTFRQIDGRRAAGGQASTAKALQCGECGYRYGRGLLERDVIWLDGECRFDSAHILGEGSFAQAKHRVAWFELGYVSAGGFDLAGDINAGSFDFWFAQAEEYANDVRPALH